jgi:MFS transporter, MFS domain-containing protein family, molybdate-anion transporter
VCDELKVSQDATLMTLCLTQTCFEGSMYLFVFLWVPSMQEASPAGAILPLGFIFSSFMFSMMIGSLVYSSLTSHMPPNSSDTSLVLHAKLSTLVCLVAGISLASSMASTSAEGRFWSFCVFEGCVGIYYPVQGMLRGSVISNDHRATVSL